ncbi:unnamed protein product [Trichobilharzia szidati]|nr:unnamed protein product [Trichobilharzia szidati]
MNLGEWIEFFEAAGVPPKVRETYAAIFVEHRINHTVLADLDKDHLKDMGITVIGDIISILKQCKKMRHEVSVAPVPVVTSTTSKDSSSEDKKPLPKDVISVVPARRRMDPKIEGKYIVKMPKGTTPKTQKILASIKQKTAMKSSQQQQQQQQQQTDKPSKTTESPVSSTFGDSDADDSDNYRVIISKPNTTSSSTSGESVFNRLGGSVNRQDSPTSVLIKRTDPSSAMQRFIRLNLNQDSFSPPSRLSASASEDMFSSTEESLDFKVVRQFGMSGKNSQQSARVKTPLKRHASETVFSRLSAPSSMSPLEDQLSYKGVLKKSRIQSSSFDSDSIVPSPLKSPLRPYTEGVLAQENVHKVSVKRRLGNRPMKSNAPVHSRLGRASNPI